MNAAEFVAKWRRVELKESAAAKEHFADAHRKLDEAVFAAYGWPADLPDAALLEKLLALNLASASKP